MRAGISNATPVRGGDSDMSRAWTDSAAPMFPPADVPPSTNPAVVGLAPRAVAFAAA